MLFTFHKMGAKFTWELDSLIVGRGSLCWGVNVCFDFTVEDLWACLHKSQNVFRHEDNSEGVLENTSHFVQQG